MTIKLSKPVRNGDIVRVTLEGPARNADPAGFYVRDKDNMSTLVTYDHDIVKSVDVIKRQREVGEQINRNDIMAWAPKAGTVIKQRSWDGDYRTSKNWMKIARGAAQWVDSFGERAEPSAMPGGDYEIVSIA